MLAQAIVSATDTAFMGHVGDIELGAVAIGGIYYHVFIYDWFRFRYRYANSYFTT